MARKITNQGYYKDKPIEEDPDYLPRIVVKFYEGVIKRYEDGAEQILAQDSLGAWKELEQRYPGITLRRLYTSLPPEKIQELVRRAQQINADYRPPNFLTYFAIDVPKDSKPAALLEDLHAMDEVEEAYIEGKPAPPPLGNAANNALALTQDYLKAAPLGIGTESISKNPGGDGTGTHFIDIEQGWTLNHEALLAANITQLVGINRWYHGHGTAVLGQIIAGNNPVGVVGIAPQASGRVASIWPPSPADPTLPANNPNIPDAILAATGALGPGDVLVLEVQSSLWLPCEIEPAIFNNIQLATNNNIIVVEAAGNAGFNLDTIVDSNGKHVFDLHQHPECDSGAIMVAAASSDIPHTPMLLSNFGQRIDCYAWGEFVATTGDGWTGNGVKDYTEEFDGTSSATPIIAGVALVMQGVARARGLNILAAQARAILRDPANGTPSSSPTDQIGVMPDLQRIITAVQAL